VYFPFSFEEERKQKHCFVLFYVFVCPFLVTHLSPLVLVFGILGVVYTLIVLCITSFKDPGFIPKQNADPKIEELLRQESEERKNNPYSSRGTLPKLEIQVKNAIVKSTYCTTCNLYRPPRSSHCSECDSCVNSFDHHCIWVGNCVGLRNYKYFVQFVYCAAFMALYFCTFCIVEIIFLVGDSESFLEAILKAPFSPIIALYAFFMFFSVAGLACYHQYLICFGRTTNEEIKDTFKHTHSPWDRGCITNCIFVCFPPSWPKLGPSAKGKDSTSLARKLRLKHLPFGDDGDERKPLSPRTEMDAV